MSIVCYHTLPASSRRKVRVSHYSSNILTKGLDVVFCGINPAATAPILGNNFSSKTNRFWSVLHLAGFTDSRIDPANERRLLEYSCGITAVVQRPTKRAADVSLHEFRQARPAFEAEMRDYAPRALAFLGKRALAAMIPEVKIAWGRQNAAFAGVTTWVLPNPSGLNRAFTLDDLVAAYSELRVALGMPKRN